MTRAARWVADHRVMLPTSGVALDVASGGGRHSLWLAAEGFTVVAVDRDAEAVQALASAAARLGLPVHATVLDLERPEVDLGRARFDVIVVVNYLHRPLFPVLLRALRPGGVLVYETFTRAQALRGRPRNPDFLLEAGELTRLVAPLTVLDAREGDYEGQWIASVVARKEARA